MIRGLYGIADATTSQDPELLARAMLEGGCGLIQIRCKGWSEVEVEAVVRAVLPAAELAGALLIVNDWPEVAARTRAHGVHVGQGDMSAEQVRQIVGENCLIGVSHNTSEELSPSLAVADYLAVGPVFPTIHMSVPKPVRGLEWVAEARARTALPVVAIGGIGTDRIAAVKQAGADAWAVIGAICGAEDPVEATRLLVEAS